MVRYPKDDKWNPGRMKGYSETNFNAWPKSQVTVVLAGNHEFRKYVLYGIIQAKKVGYGVLVYDLGGLGFGHKIITASDDDLHYQPVYAPCTFKPTILTHAFMTVKFGRLLYLDGDAVLKGPVQEVYDRGLHVAATVRVETVLKDDPLAGTINTGVIFISKGGQAVPSSSDQTGRFLEEWTNESIAMNSEQGAFNKLWKRYREKDGFKEVPGEVYNCYYPELMDKAKIIHYKGDMRKWHPSNN